MSTSEQVPAQVVRRGNFNGNFHRPSNGISRIPGSRPNGAAITLFLTCCVHHSVAYWLYSMFSSLTGSFTMSISTSLTLYNLTLCRHHTLPHSLRSPSLGGCIRIHYVSHYVSSSFAAFIAHFCLCHSGALFLPHSLHLNLCWSAPSALLSTASLARSLFTTSLAHSVMPRSLTHLLTICTASLTHSVLLSCSVLR